jgi:transposase
MSSPRTRKTRKKSAATQNPSFPPMQPNVAGIDIGSVEHWVAGPPRDDKPNVRKFGTTTPDLHQIVDWLLAQGVTSVAMESTSVYWIPLYELVESRGIQPVLVNARHLHNVPGRKTDYQDCQWLQALHSRGLLRGSFRPSESITQLRALHRQMTNLIAERTKCVQWMEKELDQMNIQVHRAVTDVTGKTGMTILRAIVAGERDPVRLAKLRDARCRKPVEEIARHLTGTWRDEHIFNLSQSLKLHDAIDEMIGTYEERLQALLQDLRPEERRDQSVPSHPVASKEKGIKARGEQTLRNTLWQFAGVDLTRIDGIGASTAQILLTEAGTDLAAFPDEHHFVAWLRLCPRAATSGGKPVKKRRNAMGANRIANALRMAAVSVHRSKTALGAAYRRIARVKGAAVAVFATARRLAQLAFRMLRYGQDYVDVGEQAYEARFEVRQLASLKERARSLGFALVQEDPRVAT